jgi:TetR/AcrR family transcriptional regulator, cholesterol catabolism regulator
MPETSNISRRRQSALSDGGAEYTAKREELVRIAAKLFKESGFKSTRLADIAKEAGLDRATLYYYVGSKEELFREVVEGVLDANIAEAERLLADPSIDWQTRLRLIVERLMVSYEENYPFPYVYIQEQMHQVTVAEPPWAREINRKTKYLESVVMTYIREGMKLGQLRDDMPVRLMANALFGMFNWTHRWFKPGEKMRANDISAAFCKIFFNGALPVTSATLAKAKGKSAKSKGG